MTALPSPRVANWLLRRFGSGPNRESLVGDLDEQFTRGRSAFWYWRQVLSAILVGAADDLREHKRLALRSATITWAIVIPWVEATWALYLWADHEWASAWVNRSVLLSEFWIPFGGGLCLVWCLASALSGWLSARMAARHLPALIIASALAQLPFTLWWSRPVWLHAGMIFRISASLWVPNYLWAAVVLVGMPACTVLGGLMGVRPDEPTIERSAR